MRLARPKTLKELALEHLRERIIDGSLPMGTALSERRISEDLGVSKSPVREALAQLREEGLVTIAPQKGAYVFILTEEEVAQICDFRLAIEYAAIELAITRNPEGLANDMNMIVRDMMAAKKAGNTRRYLHLDTSFHELIFLHAGNDYLTASYERYVGKIAALRTHLSVYPDHTDLSFGEHRLLEESVRHKDLKQSKRILAEHIARTRETYRVISESDEDIV
jgi:DNA-binding GntR family transcriptional regulator